MIIFGYKITVRKLKPAFPIMDTQKYHREIVTAHHRTTALLRHEVAMRRKAVR